MSRLKTNDRDAVTSQDGPVVAVRLTPREKAALDRLVEHDQLDIEAQGHTYRATGASVLRRLLIKEARSLGFIEKAPKPSVVGPVQTVEPKPVVNERQLTLESAIAASQVAATVEPKTSKAQVPVVASVDREADPVQAALRVRYSAALESEKTTRKEVASLLSFNSLSNLANWKSGWVGGKAKEIKLNPERTRLLDDFLGKLGF